MSRKFYIETYGCQMNVADSEVVASVLNMDGFEITNQVADADLILVPFAIMPSRKSSHVCSFSTL